MSITITSAEDPNMSCNRKEAQVASDKDNKNDDGWLMLDSPLSGEFFQIEVDVEELQDELVREFLGYEVWSEVGADH